MPFSLRLDPKTEAKIRRLATATGQTKSAVVREAMAQYGDETSASPAAESAFDRLQPFLGIVRTGGRNLSARTHATYRDALRKKLRERRTR